MAWMVRTANRQICMKMATICRVCVNACESFDVSHCFPTPLACEHSFFFGFDLPSRSIDFTVTCVVFENVHFVLYFHSIACCTRDAQLHSIPVQLLQARTQKHRICVNFAREPMPFCCCVSDLNCSLAACGPVWTSL